MQKIIPVVVDTDLTDMNHKEANYISESILVTNFQVSEWIITELITEKIQLNAGH